MPKMQTQIRCPNCRNPIEAMIEQLIDVGQEPAAKTRLLSGTINHVRCPICGYDGALSIPLVYHDPAKELLLTYMPVEVGLPKDDQERLIGQLINRVIEHLTPEQRKGYLLQPQAVLTLQGLIERVLQADGVTPEDLEAQRQRMRLFETLLSTPDDQVEGFVAEHDNELDSAFFQLATLALQGASNQPGAQAALQRLDTALRASSLGKKLAAQEANLRQAAEDLRQLGDKLTRQDLVKLFLQAPDDGRLVALTNLTRPALDYSFFQVLSDAIEDANAQEKAKIESVRSRLLELTQEIDKAQEARAAQSAALLNGLMQAEDLDQALQAALPAIDELFLGILAANIRAAEERKDSASLEKLRRIDERLNEILRQSVPPSLQLAQRLLDIEDEAQAAELLTQSADLIDDALLSALVGTAEQLEQSGDHQSAVRLRALHRQALRTSMRKKMG
jgi:hypothetical protein